ncbi:50S ribosomal protein L13 [Bacteroidetes bacterium endosymbiont of Geopemphigus sp.]|uniref:50S ribosomal protein L13 n=1 Tax=Bacteroidetes bacterium endosymbiont of Geopemphigus sp. TaxID=2047937 RepID=UPI000CD096D1|nr:50S ribosomal protein L13 [Bacteroidetes bacterium endosymbiont of Geopemphigus sp.]
MDSLSFKTISVSRSALQKRWLVVDATDESLGRLASSVAKIIRGKHKSSFTPHINCGDHVIVINAEKIGLKGNNWEVKEYIRYTGYPGGQRFTSAREQLIKDPRIIIEKAVKGMLPKNRLGNQISKNLHVHTGSNHGHEAQKPVVFNFTKKH